MAHSQNAAMNAGQQYAGVRVSAENNGRGAATNASSAHRRKQDRPQRSLQQLASVADKILNGIIVIEPAFALDTGSGASFAYDDYAFDGGDDEPGSLMQGVRDEKRAARRRRAVSKKEHNDGADKPSRGRRGRSTESSGTEGSMDPPTGTQTRTQSRATTGKNPVVGVALPEDTELAGVARRRAIYDALVLRRRSSGGTATFGSGSGSPLDVSSAPGASLLDDSEVEQCMALRLYPLQYFQCRDVLLGNVRSQGFYKKSAAQKMLHIDVNKTGRLYDYFVSRGWMPESAEALGTESDPEHVGWHVIA